MVSRWLSCPAMVAVHRISPTALNVRANIWALKSLGVEWVLAVSAVGSMRENIPAPGRGDSRPNSSTAPA